MGTEVLRPQDCLFERIRAPPASFYRRRCQNGNSSSSSNNANSNPRSNRKPAARSERSGQRKRYQSEPLKRSSPEDVKIVNSRVMEKVTILRRGESLDSKIKSQALRKEGGYLVACGIGTLGPEPVTVSNQIRIADLKSLIAGKVDVYAGSAFAMSPAPSSLPLPSFSKMKSGSKIVGDPATRDLRRLLRIDA